MNITDLIYHHADPCVDLYCSKYYAELVFGSRRRSSDGQTLRTSLTHRDKLWPDNSEFGSQLLSILKPLTPIRTTADSSNSNSPKFWSISSATSYEDFESSFWPFVVWTKTDSAVPLIVGTPICSYYSDSFNRRRIEKSVSDAELGFQVRALIEEVTSELTRAGLDRWGK